MSTVRDVAQSVIASIDSPLDLGVSLVADYINFRYAELAGKIKFRHLRQVSNLYAPAPVTTGTVTCTLGSNLIVGSGTAFDRSMIGWQFRAFTNWYTVVDVQPPNLVLDVPYAEPTNSSVSFYLVQRYLPLDRRVRHVGEVVHPRLFRRLLPKTLDWLDTHRPSRLLVAALPTEWAEGPSYRGDNPETLYYTKTIEVYPVSTQVELFKYVWWEIPHRLRIDDPLAPEIDANVLADGALVSIYQHFKNKALMQAVPDTVAAAQWGNYEARQRTIWDGKIEAAVIADKMSIDADVELFNGYRNALESDLPDSELRAAGMLSLITVQ